MISIVRTPASLFITGPFFARVAAPPTASEAKRFVAERNAETRRERAAQAAAARERDAELARLLAELRRPDRVASPRTPLNILDIYRERAARSGR